MVQTRGQLRRQEQQRATILATYRCPDDEDNYRCTRANCPFGHRNAGIGDNAPFPDNLRQLPPLICRPHITRNACPNRSAVSCTLGYHPSFDQLNDLMGYIRLVYRAPRIYRTVDYVLRGGVYVRTVRELPDDPRDAPERVTDPCSICFEAISGDYGLMENCDHFFCVPCIQGWFEAQLVQTDTSCPICRVACDRVLPWPLVIRDRAEKAQTFRTFNRNVLTF